MVAVTEKIWNTLKYEDGFRLVDAPAPKEEPENELMKLFKKDLIKMCKAQGIPFRTNVTKKELVEALEKAGG